VKPLYLVTGGAGFIGSHICEELVRQGHAVRAFDNLYSGYRRNIEHLGQSVEFVEGDIRDPDALDRACRCATHIFHQAALVSVFDSVEKPAEANDINITGTLNVLLAAKKNGAQRVVLASSAAVYGNDPVLPKTEAMKPLPESPYAVSKVTGEYYLRVFAQLHGLETASLRYFNVFGPRQDPRSFYSGVISRFTDDVINNRPPTVFGDGLQSRDFVFVKDVVQANMLVMHSGSAGHGEVFNIASGKTATLLDLLSVIGRLSKKAVTPAHREARAGDIRHSAADISLAAATLSYKPEYSLQSGLSELWKWLNR
jgi:nucleoside-diphosphate-sugar epimerase